MKHTADEQMVRNALGDEGFDELSQPPEIEADTAHPLWKPIEKGLRDIFDPEIPVNIYELGLIYKVSITDRADGKADVYVEMTLTSPGCPVAQEMPGWVQGAILPIEGIGDVDVDIIWDPAWTPAMMAETAKLQLNMFT